MMVFWHIQYIILCHRIQYHDDVIKWNYLPRYWPFVRWIHRSPVDSPHKGQWRGTLMFYLICTRRNVWRNSRDAGDLRRHRAHDNVTVLWHHWFSDLLTLWTKSSWHNDITNLCQNEFESMVCKLHILFKSWYAKDSTLTHTHTDIWALFDKSKYPDLNTQVLINCWIRCWSILLQK